jgi:predicted DNA-binding transcriptional regulator YafY
MAAAQLKLLAALPAEGRRGAAKVASRFHLDPIAWFRSAEHAEILPSLALAVWNSRRIRVRYDAWAGVVERELEPLGLVLKAGVWYLVAAPKEAGAGGKPRTYRVSSIETLALTDDAFTRTDDFDLAGYWAAWAKDFETRLYRGEATLRISPAGLKRLCAVSPEVDLAGRVGEAADAEGWHEVTLPIESLDHAAGEILKLGAEAEVLTPPDLREKMAEIAGRLAALYP